MSAVFNSLGIGTGFYPGESNLWVPDGPGGDPAAVLAHADVCVDVGSSVANSALASLAAKRKPGIVVLTHADSDHIGGFPVFVRNTRPSQVWVPYEWALIHSALIAVLDDAGRPGGNSAARGDPQDPITQDDISSIVRRTGGFEDRIEVAKPPERPRDPRGAPDRQRHPSEPVDEDPRAGEPGKVGVESGGDIGELDRLLDEHRAQIVENIERVIGWLRDDAEHADIRKSAWGAPKKVAEETFRRGVKVAKVISLGRAAGARLRYFSVDAPSPAPWHPYQWAGIAGLVTIVNAVEVHPPPAVSYDDPLLALARLAFTTIANRRALVTLLWNRSSSAGHVLVWSDSAGLRCLGPGQVPWDSVSLMTAPHHGSANPAHRPIWDAWTQHQRPDGTSIPVIVSGGQSSQRGRIADEYLRATPRACTNCRHQSRVNPQTVTAEVDGMSVNIVPRCG